MLKSWSIENFKAIVNSGELKLAPITILAGKNSSGKSSLLQSILMIAQTLSNQIPDRPLLPNERIVQLGTFEDILSDYSDSRKLTVKFELSDDFYDDQQERATSFDQKVLVTFSRASENKSFSALDASKVIVEDISIAFDILSYSTRVPSFDESSEEEIGPQTSLVTGKFVIRKVSRDEIEQYRESVGVTSLDSVAQKEKGTHYIGNITHFLMPYPINTERRIEAKHENEYEVTLFHFMPRSARRIFEEKLPFYLELADEANLDDAVEKIIEFFASCIRYLGPLRADPGTIQKRFAPTSQLDEVGFKGEYSAVVYHTNQTAMINWYNPNIKQTEIGTLQIALDTWVRYLGVAHQITTEMAGTIGIAWKVVHTEGQKAHTLPEVGVGLSQILPILVTGLLSPRDSLLIMEQPELHLHSQVQAHLGDFFVGIAKCHKQCLIETHSENIVSQLRYHIVEAGGQDKSDCIIYFVDQDEKGAAKFEPIEISPNGNILNWPDGFFDETMHQENRINAASIRRRARLKKNG